MQVLSTHPSDHRGTNALKKALADIDLPGWAVAYGDRPEMLAAAQAERYTGKKIVHVGGGETFHHDPHAHPDHWTRDAISMISYVHCVASLQAVENLQRIGIIYKVFHTGCPSLDEVVEFAKTPRKRDGSRFTWLPESPGDFAPVEQKRLSEAEFLERLATCGLFVSNSSAAVREAPILETPVLLIGDRQSGRHGPFHNLEGKACECIKNVILECCT